MLATHIYTEADFECFKTHCRNWLDKFGITEYEIDFHHAKLDTVARCTYDVKAKLACFQLAKEIDYDFCNQDDLNKLALHEVIHLLLAELGYTIHETKDAWSDLSASAEHTAVNRLIRAIL